MSHGDDIAASYEHRYAEPDADDDKLFMQLASFSVAVCLAVKER